MSVIASNLVMHQPIHRALYKIPHAHMHVRCALWYSVVCCSVVCCSVLCCVVHDFHIHNNSVVFFLPNSWDIQPPIAEPIVAPNSNEHVMAPRNNEPEKMVNTFSSKHLHCYDEETCFGITPVPDDMLKWSAIGSNAPEMMPSTQVWVLLCWLLA